MGSAVGRSGQWFRVNRDPVLTLWAAVVAERLGLDRLAALTPDQAAAMGSRAGSAGADEDVERPVGVAGHQVGGRGEEGDGAAARRHRPQ